MTARWSGIRHGGQNANTERQHRKRSKHLANGHELDLLRLLRPLKCHSPPHLRSGNAAAANTGTA